jgi:hypothetical protein
LSLVGDFKFLIDFVFDWKAVTIPTEPSRNEMTCLRCVSADYVLDGACSNVAVVRSTSGKWWSIVKCIRWEMLGEFELLLEALVLLPVVKNDFFFIGERQSFRSCVIRDEILELNSVLLNIGCLDIW